MHAVLLTVVLGIAAAAPLPQSQEQVPPAARGESSAEQSFYAGNGLMEQGKYEQALARYREGLSSAPTEPALLYNGGLAAYLSNDFNSAALMWRRLSDSEPENAEARIKLVQAYQALGNLTARDTERAIVFELRSSGKAPDLAKEESYCRDQFVVNGRRVYAFEHFELRGERAIRYTFVVLDETGNREELRVSLGSYESTNAVWRETADPKPKPGERLFHLDGYFKGGHSTYGIYRQEPAYDEVRSSVIGILEKAITPVSSTTKAPAP